MNTPLPAPKLHPALLAAALSVSGLALAGIGVLTGTLPGAPHDAESTPATTIAAQPAPTAVVPGTVAASPAASAPRKISAPVAAAVTKVTTGPAPAGDGALRRTAAKPDDTAAVSTSHEPLGIEVTGKPTATAAEPQVKRAAASAEASPAAAACHDCGVVEAVHEVVKEGEGTGIGVVGGAVVGGLVGSLIGKGRGNDAAKVLGAIGGGYAGHQIEKNARKQTSYEVVVRFEDGTTQRLRQETAPTWRQGDRVKMVNGVLTAS